MAVFGLELFFRGCIQLFQVQTSELVGKETPLEAAIAAFASRTVINASYPKIFLKKFLRI